jgi:pilus assembly protein CpaB
MSFIKNVNEYFEVHEIPGRDVPKGAFSRLDDMDLKNPFRVLHPFSEGSILTREDVLAVPVTVEKPGAKDKPREGLAAVLPPGMRALAFRVDNDDVGAAFILPGSHIDLVGVERTAPDKVVSKKVLEKVLVLAIDTARGGDDKAAVASTITVAVTPADALKLLRVTEKRTIRAVLRKPDDK